jgi:hypothetical protein
MKFFFGYALFAIQSPTCQAPKHRAFDLDVIYLCEFLQLGPPLYHIKGRAP